MSNANTQDSSLPCWTPYFQEYCLGAHWLFGCCCCIGPTGTLTICSTEMLTGLWSVQSPWASHLGKTTHTNLKNTNQCVLNPEEKPSFLHAFNLSNTETSLLLLLSAPGSRVRQRIYTWRNSSKNSKPSFTLISPTLLPSFASKTLIGLVASLPIMDLRLGGWWAEKGPIWTFRI